MEKKKKTIAHSKKRADKYEEKVTFDGTFEDMVKISLKDADKKAKEKSEKKKQ